MAEAKLNVVPKEENKKQEEVDVNNLKNICHQLAEQNKQLVQRLQGASWDYMFTVLRMLVDIVNGNTNNYNPEFIKYASVQIEEKIYALTSKDEQPSTEPPADSN